MRTFKGVLIGLFFYTSFSFVVEAQKKMSVDILITGAIVFDGSGRDSLPLNIGIVGDRIAFLGKPNQKLPQAKNTINAKGFYLAPGFIDPHTHVESDLSSDSRKANLPYLMQGVTTVFAGNDGTSPFPIGEKLKRWSENGIGTNAALFVGHGSVRKMVLGNKNTKPDSQEMTAMKTLVENAMLEGALGLSTGLFYAPGSFADKQEVIELAKVAAQYGGIYDTHLRDESSYTIGLMAALQEAVDIGQEARIPVHISHIKALGADVWGKSGEMIKKIEEYRSKGFKITANQYPYNASRTSLIAALIPRWAEDGGYEALLQQFNNSLSTDSLRIGIEENIRRRGGVQTLVFSSSSVSGIEGKSLQEVSKAYGINDVETVIQILRQDKEIRVVSFNMRDDDLDLLTQQPWVMTGSDGTSGHPRKYGTFPKRIREYVLEKKLISMAFAIYASSGLTASTFGIRDRGFIREGYFADIIIFDPTRLLDKATFENPNEFAEGIEYVLVNGRLVVNQGKYTGALAGKSLRLND